MADNNAIGAMPVWAKFIAYLGFPIAVATLLLWVVVKQLDLHNHLLELHDSKVDVHMMSTLKHGEEMHDAVHRLTYVLQVMCQNSADTKVNAERCLEKP